jgi:peptidoglycan/LPS O-acetylase OafA/YrhL
MSKMAASFVFGVSFFISMVACFFVAKATNKTPLRIGEPEGVRDGCIDGLRGYLALMVAGHHYFIFHDWIKYGDWLPPEINYINNFGKVAVCIFFMITGYLFVGKLRFSLMNKKPVNWTRTYISRIFRIVPLYFFAVIITIIYVFINSRFNINVSINKLMKEIVAWFLYLGGAINGDSDAKRVTAGVTWTLKYEWLFYLSLPLINIFLNKRILIIPLIAAALYLFFINKEYFGIQTKYAIYFLYGGVFCYIKPYVSGKWLCYLKSHYASFISLILLSISLLTSQDISSITISLSIMLFFFPIVCGNSMFGLLELSESKKLGEVSFSIYLLHGIVFYTILVYFVGKENMPSKEIYLYFLPIGMIAITIVSFCSFKLIEKPFISSGKYLFELIKPQKIEN